MGTERARRSRLSTIICNRSYGFRMIMKQTSPMRPIACESDDIILMAPMSCNMSSAAIVSARILDSANATSSGMFLSRWWQTICNNQNILTSNLHTVFTILSWIIVYQHIKVLIYSVWSKWSGRICWRGQHIFYPTHFDDIWSMTATCTFTVHKIVRTWEENWKVYINTYPR